MGTGCSGPRNPGGSGPAQLGVVRGEELLALWGPFPQWMDPSTLEGKGWSQTGHKGRE